MSVDLRELHSRYERLVEEARAAREEADTAENTHKVASSKLKSKLEQISLVKEKINIEKILIKEIK